MTVATNTTVDEVIQKNHKSRDAITGVSVFSCLIIVGGHNM